MARMTVNDADHPLDGRDAADRLLADLRDRDDPELWVYHGGATLAALLNRDCGWFLLLRHEGDAGLTSRNPQHATGDEAAVVFRLGNGQVDTYPKSWTFDRAAVLAAVAGFAATGVLPAGILRYDDAGEPLAPGPPDPSPP